jgi:hypothetical protein
MKRNVFHAAIALICLATSGLVHAGQVINFDSLAARGNPVTGPALDSYLAQYGATVSGATPGTAVTVYDARDIYFSISSDLPARAFTLDSPDIRSVVIASNNHHFAAFGSVILDNFTLSSVPEPSSLNTATIGAIVLLGHQLLRHRSRSSGAGDGAVPPGAGHRVC